MKLKLSRFSLSFILISLASSCAWAVEFNWNTKIDTDHLQMRLAKKEDVKFLQQLYAQDHTYYITDKQKLTPQQTKAIAQDCTSGTWDIHSYIISLKNSTPIGMFQVCYLPEYPGLSDIIPKNYQQEVLSKNGINVGYLIDQDYLNRGYASEALKGFKNYINTHKDSYYKNLSISALVALIDPENKPSIKVSQKNGFVLKGPQKNSAGEQLYFYDFTKQVISHVNSKKPWMSPTTNMNLGKKISNLNDLPLDDDIFWIKNDSLLEQKKDEAIMRIITTTSLKELSSLQDQLANEFSCNYLGNNPSFYCEIGLPNGLDKLRDFISTQKEQLELSVSSNKFRKK